MLVHDREYPRIKKIYQVPDKILGTLRGSQIRRTWYMTGEEMLDVVVAERYHLAEAPPRFSHARVQP